MLTCATGAPPFTRGATTGWFAVGGADAAPGGSEGSAGSTACGELDGYELLVVGVGEAEGVSLGVDGGVALDLVGSGVGP